LNPFAGYSALVHRDGSLLSGFLAFGSPGSPDLSGGIESVIPETGELGEIAQPIR
jgi:hypothetical protein